MKILVTNDDGINAIGLKMLAEKAIKYGDVVVVAPLVEQSAKSHSINIKQGLMFQKVDDIVPGVETYTVNSTPADCVRFVEFYLHRDFDIIFSGINNGYNVGEDIIYSGTVAGASEGVFDGKKGIAFSATYKNLSEIDIRFDDVMQYFFDHQLLDKCDLYNVNVPLNAKGIKLTHQGSTHFDAYYELQNNQLFAKGKPNFAKDTVKINSDVTALYQNYISITPLTVDRTDLKALERIIKS